MNIIINSVMNSTLSIDIVGRIGEGFFDEGFTISNLKEKIDEIDNFDTIEMNITSLGGSAYEAINIYNYLDFLKKTKNIKIITNVIGAVASAACTIVLAGDERNMMNNSLLLAHFCSSSTGGKIEEIERELLQMKSINENILKIYKEVTNLDEEKLTELLNSEKWMNSKEALELNFVTKVIENQTKIKNIIMENIINEINQSDLPKIENIINKEVTEVIVSKESNEKTVEPENIFENQLKLKNEIINNLNNEILILKNEINKFEQLIKNQEIDKILDEAIKFNKINNSLKDNYKKLLEKNFEDTKDLINKMVPQKVSSLTSLITEKSVDDRSDWTIRDWETKDIEGLKEMYSNNNERYTKLFNEFYNKK